MNWMLALVLVILIVNTIIGLRAGFIKMAFSLVSMVIALILTVFISPYVNDLLKGNEKFYGVVKEKAVQALALDQKEAETTEQAEYIGKLPLPKSFKETLIENKNKGVDNIKEYIADYVAGTIINALSFMITFAVIFVFLWMISLALNILSKLPILHQINKMAGLIAGLLHGLMIVWILFILLNVFGGTQFGQDAFVMIEENVLLSTIYNNNLLLGFVSSATKLIL